MSRLDTLTPQDTENKHHYKSITLSLAIYVECILHSAREILDLILVKKYCVPAEHISVITLLRNKNDP